MSVEPIAADLDLDDVEAALLHAAVGDYSAEAAVLLLANDGYWLARLRAAGLVTIEAEPVGGQLWARIEWPELDPTLAQGRLHGSEEELAVLRVAVSLADDDRSTSPTWRWRWAAERSSWCWPRWPTPPAATITVTPLRPAPAPVPACGSDRWSPGRCGTDQPCPTRSGTPSALHGTWTAGDPAP